MTATEIIELLKRKKNLKNQKEVAEFLGVDQRKLATWKVRGGFPLKYIMPIFPLLTEEEKRAVAPPMFVVHADIDIPQEPMRDYTETTLSNFRKINRGFNLQIKQLNDSIGAAISHPSFEGGFELVNVCELFSVQDCDNMYTGIVNGDSMQEANLQQGDAVVIEKTKEVKHDDIVCVMHNGSILVKRYAMIGSKHYLFSDNPAFNPILINGDDSIEIYGVVKNIIKAAF